MQNNRTVDVLLICPQSIFSLSDSIYKLIHNHNEEKFLLNILSGDSPPLLKNNNRKSTIHKRNMFYTIIDPGAQGHQRVSGREEVWFVTWLLPSDTCLAFANPKQAGTFCNAIGSPQCNLLHPHAIYCNPMQRHKGSLVRREVPSPSPPSSPNCSQVSYNVNCHQSALQCNAIGNNAPPRFQIATLDRATPFITWLVTAGTTMLQLLQSEGDHTWQPCLILVKGLWKFISFEVKDDQNGS